MGQCMATWVHLACMAGEHTKDAHLNYETKLEVVPALFRPAALLVSLLDKFQSWVHRGPAASERQVAPQQIGALRIGVPVCTAL
jgi:hypothetical protein